MALKYGETVPKVQAPLKKVFGTMKTSPGRLIRPEKYANAPTLKTKIFHYSYFKILQKLENRSPYPSLDSESWGSDFGSTDSKLGPGSLVSFKTYQKSMAKKMYKTQKIRPSEIPDQTEARIA